MPRWAPGGARSSAQTFFSAGLDPARVVHAATLRVSPVDDTGDELPIVRLRQAVTHELIEGMIRNQEALGGVSLEPGLGKSDALLGPGRLSSTA